MAGKLSAAFVRTVTEAGKYGDGRGLMLLVHPSGRKQFVQRISIQGTRRDLGLGAFPEVSLAEARDRADENRLIARKGLDPTVEPARTPTFAEAAEEVIKLHSPSWTERGKSASQWSSSLETYAIPGLGQKSVDAITTADVMAALGPIWNTKRVTAQRVRQRISTIMRWAIANGHRLDNPAGDALVAALPKNGVQKVHHPAIPHADVREALARVRASSGRPVTKLAFEFLMLTGVRSAEVRLARREEVDLENAMWTVPAEHTKDKRAHRIPLSGRAREILEIACGLPDRSGLVFPSRGGTALSDAAFSKLVRRLGIPAVPHGFRSSFRDWCGETGVPREVAEACLAHSLDQVEGAYARSDLFERRRALMESWSDYLAARWCGHRSSRAPHTVAVAVRRSMPRRPVRRCAKRVADGGAQTEFPTSTTTPRMSVSLPASTVCSGHRSSSARKIRRPSRSMRSRTKVSPRVRGRAPQPAELRTDLGVPLPP